MIHTYRRVSTSRQDLGLDAQQAAINRWLVMQPPDAILAEHVDDGVSGSVPLADRDGAGAMLAALVDGDTVVAAKLDRLFRSVADAANTIADWDRRGVKLVALAEAFDMSNPYGRAMAQMASVFAELERAMIRERTKAALAAKRARGEVLGSEAPYGWALVNGGLVTNMDEQQVLAIIKQCRDAGMQTPMIATKLNKMGVKPRIAHHWTRFSVWNACRNLDKRPAVMVD